VSEPEPPSPLDLLRDKRAIVDTGLGPVVFVIVYALAGVNTAAAVAVGLSVVLMIERIARGKSAVNAVGGLLGTGVAAFIAVKTGRPEGYFVPRMLYQLALAVAFAGSVLVRRPLGLYIGAAVYRAEPGWTGDRGVRRVFSAVTWWWAALFALRAAVYAVLIAAHKPGELAAASIAIGWPPFIALAWASYRYVPWRLERLGAPPPRPS
jgi:preprotein translocase subunit SecG